MGLKQKAAGFLLATFTGVAAFSGYAETLSQAPSTPSAASAEMASSPLHANKLHLAYIQTPSAPLNNESRTGLEALSRQMAQRSAITPHGVVALDIERDDLAFYPFIYWPVTSATPPLSNEARSKVQNYINTGGTIVFDTGYVSGNTQQALKTMLGDVVIKPLVPLDRDHTLTRSFYLVTDLTGSRNGTVLVESPRSQDANTVSSVIVGDKMWARSWVNLIGYDHSRDEDKNRVLRSGINMVTYALTGDYKADQIHTRSILERLAR